jgi:hypothetical protein
MVDGCNDLIHFSFSLTFTVITFLIWFLWFHQSRNEMLWIEIKQVYLTSIHTYALIHPSIMWCCHQIFVLRSWGDRAKTSTSNAHILRSNRSRGVAKKWGGSILTVGIKFSHIIRSCMYTRRTCAIESMKCSHHTVATILDRFYKLLGRIERGWWRKRGWHLKCW